jgi:hypothetical protein
MSIRALDEGPPVCARRIEGGDAQFMDISCAFCWTVTTGNAVCWLGGVYAARDIIRGHPVNSYE